MAQEIKMSAAGLKAMQEELEYLKTVRRKELAEEILDVKFAKDCGNADAEAAALKPGEALLLENLRFYPEEIGRASCRERV